MADSSSESNIEYDGQAVLYSTDELLSIGLKLVHFNEAKIRRAIILKLLLLEIYSNPNGLTKRVEIEMKSLKKKRCNSKHLHCILYLPEISSSFFKMQYKCLELQHFLFDLRHVINRNQESSQKYQLLNGQPKSG